MLTLIDQPVSCVQRHCLHYVLDVLEESHTAQLLLDYYCTGIEVSVLSEGGGGDRNIAKSLPSCGECLIS